MKNEKITENAEIEAPEVERTVKMIIPKVKGNTGDEFVSVNNRQFLLQRGKEIEVPECVYEVLSHKYEMEELAEERRSLVKI